MDKQKRYAESEKRKAARERVQANRKAKRDAERGEQVAAPNRRGKSLPTPSPDADSITRREKSIEEAFARVFDNHMNNGRIGLAVESLCRSWHEKMDRMENDLKPF
jgi:hypothetical protein